MKPVVFALAVFALAGCAREEKGAEPQISMDLMDGLSSADPAEQEAGLSRAKITPYGAKLSREALLSLSAIFQQMVAVAQAHNRPIPVLRADSDLYVSVRRSLEDVPGWHSLETQAAKDGKLELHALGAFIAAAHQNRPRR